MEWLWSRQLYIQGQYVNRNDGCYFDRISIKQRVEKIVRQWLLAQGGGTKDQEWRREEIKDGGWYLRRRVVDGGTDVSAMWGEFCRMGKRAQ